MLLNNQCVGSGFESVGVGRSAAAIGRERKVSRVVGEKTCDWSVAVSRMERGPAKLLASSMLAEGGHGRVKRRSIPASPSTARGFIRDRSSFYARKETGLIASACLY